MDILVEVILAPIVGLCYGIVVLFWPILALFAGLMLIRFIGNLIGIGNKDDY